MQKQKKISKEDLQEKILDKFGTQKALADELGISEQNLSDKINTRSFKFLKQLKDLGVAISNSQIVLENKFHNIEGEIEFNSHSNNNGNEEIEELRKDLKQKINYIERLERENAELKELLSKFKGLTK